MEENKNNTQLEYPYEYGAIIPILELNKQIILELDLMEIEVIIQVSSYLKKLVISLTPNIISYYIDNNQSTYLERWAYRMMRKHKFDILRKLCDTAYINYELYIGHTLLARLLDNYSTDIHSDDNEISECYESLKFIIDYNINNENFIDYIHDIESDNDKLFTLMRDLTMLMSDDSNINVFSIINYIIGEIRYNYNTQSDKLGKLEFGLIALKDMIDNIG